jgi:pimeloyl-ACP methyl ester carboxylesterase
MNEMRQQVHFCTAPDGARIAYAEVGAGPPLVKTGHWLTHLEYDWESPVWSPFLRRIASQHRLIRYDKRGNGLSDWDVPDLSLEAFVGDLESVVAAAAPERFPLLGMSQGAAISIAYAVKHPERVTHLILYGAFARGMRKRGNPKMIEQSDALLTLMLHGWGQENPAFRQIFTTRFVPDGNPIQMEWFNELQRRTTSAENAVRIRKAVDEFDVDALLTQVRVPTLVLHCRDDAAIPFEEGRRVAAGIPGSHFVAIEGRNHVILEGDPGWDRMFDEVQAFLRT